MRKIEITREKVLLLLITLISVLFNFVNLGIEGYSNQYYAAGVKSMTLNLKNFFFVALDPAGFVTIDKPPFGFWMQAISAKIFGFSGWSILIPQALSGVLSVLLIYYLVKKSFGSVAGLLSALCLAVTPVFVAVSRNNTVDNQLILALLLACWAVSVAAEKGKFRYLALCMVLIGIGFNIKMLQAYMILPAIYVMYLFSTGTSVTKRIIHLIGGTAILLAVSLSWALIVDAIPASNRPYVGSSNNNSEIGLITGHNGTERLNFSTLFGTSNDDQQGQGGGAPRGNGGPGGFDGKRNDGQNENRTDGQQRNDRNLNGAMPENQQSGNTQPPDMNRNGSQNRPSLNKGQVEGTQANNKENAQNNGSNPEMPGNLPDGSYGSGSMPDGNMPDGGNMQPPSGGFSGGGPGGNQDGGGFGGNQGLSGTFGNQVKAGVTRLFVKSVLSDQIVWFIPLALIGFLAAAIRQRIGFRLDNRKRQALALWFMWFLPEFVYFSFNTGLFHSYYLTMMAPPIAALAGIGISEMWEMYKEGGWKSWFLPTALLANGAVQMLMLTYFMNSAKTIVTVLAVALIVLCFISTLILAILNLINRKTSVIENTPDGTEELTVPVPDKFINLKKTLIGLAVAGLMLIPATGSAAAMFKAVNNSMPGAGLELLQQQSQGMRQNDGARGNMFGEGNGQNNSYSDLETFLNNNKVNGKAQIVVGSANTAEAITLNTDIYVGSLGGFMGNEKVMTLDEFQQKVKNGEVRYVLAGSTDNRGGGGPGGSSSNDIMNWVKENGKLVSYSSSSTDTSKQVYDLIGYTEGTTK